LWYSNGCFGRLAVQSSLLSAQRLASEARRYAASKARSRCSARPLHALVGPCGFIY